jgi:hypothetical protein
VSKSCSTSGKDEKSIQGVLSENLKERDHSEDLGKDGTVILEWVSGKEWEGVDWIHLAQDKDR